MRILDRYILGKFLTNIIFAMITFIVIFIVIDAVEKLSDFIDKGTPPSEVVKYYVYYIPYIVVLINPIAMLLAVMFCIGTLSKHSELIAMKASGLSLYRIFIPLFTSAFIISAGMVAFGEYVVPEANSLKAEIENLYIKGRGERGVVSRANLTLQDSLGREVFVGQYNGYNRSASKISVIVREQNRITERMDAASMTWDKDQWVLKDVMERRFSEDNEVSRKFATLRMPAFGFTPDDLGAIQKEPEEMSYRELTAFISELERYGGDGNQWRADLYLKFSFPFANFIIVLFGAPLAASRVRSSGAVGVALSLMFCFLYFGAIKTGQSFSQAGLLPPLLGAWIGNIIFFSSSIYLMHRAPK